MNIEENNKIIFVDIVERVENNPEFWEEVFEISDTLEKNNKVK